MPYEPPPALAGLNLAQIAAAVADRRLPPLDRWDPQVTADSGMRIDTAGRWWHDGAPIGRPAMVRAFAQLLSRDGDAEGDGDGDGERAHWLITPEARYAIAVEDAAFVAVDVVRADDTLAFRLNTDELVIADADHGLRATGSADTPALYLAVRRGCEARLDRSTYAQLAELALAEGEDWSVTSGAARFSLIPR